MRRVNLLRAHGSTTNYLYRYERCRCPACRSSRAAYDIAYSAAHRDRIAAYRASRLDAAAAYRASRREQIAARNAAYYVLHREERAVRQAAYDAVHHEEKAARYSAYCAAHKEEVAAYHVAYSAAHREEKAASCRNRRARKRSNGGTHTAFDVRAQYDRQRGRCFYCDEKVGKTYHVDHVMPIIKHGSNGPENLVIACPSCNQRKGTQHPADFAGILF